MIGPGEHSDLIGAIIEDFPSRFFPRSTLVHVGGSAYNGIYFDRIRLAGLGVQVDSHGTMPDVVLHDTERGWLVVIDTVTGHGPIDDTRYVELTELFASAGVAIVYVTAFPDRTAIAPYLADIALQTEVWVADEPSHLIHFDGGRLLGPHKNE